MADIPDFTNKNRPIDPMAIANILQRKAEIEQNQRNIEQKRKDDLLAGIAPAIEAGQRIAGSAMAMAEKRNQKKGLEDLTDIVSTPPPTDPTELAQRQRDLTSALARTDKDEFVKAAMKQTFPADDKTFAPQAITYSSIKTGKPEIAIMRNGNLYYPNTDEQIPVEELGGRGFKPQFIQNADGTMQLVNVTTGGGINTVSTAPTTPPKNDEGIRIKTEINHLEKSEVDRLEKTKEDFLADGAVKAAITKQGDYELADGAIETENWVGDASLISISAKGLGRDVGALSDTDQKKYKASPELIQSVRTNWSKWAKGVIPPEDRETFKKALKIAKEKNRGIIEKKQSDYGRIARSRVKNLDENFAKKYIYDQSAFATKPNDSANKADAFFDALLGKNK